MGRKCACRKKRKRILTDGASYNLAVSVNGLRDAVYIADYQPKRHVRSRSMRAIVGDAESAETEIG